VQSCGAAELLLTARQLQEEAQQAAQAAHLQRPEPGFESMEHLSVDTQAVEALLACMDFGVGEAESG